jgi:chromosome segregation ATPase
MKVKQQHNIPDKLSKEQVTSRKQITRGTSKPLASKKLKEASSKNQLASLDTGVKFCARKYNDCKAKADKLQSILCQKKDALTELKRERDSLTTMIEGKNNGAKQLSKLRSDIEEVTDACEVKLHYRLQLNYIHLRQTKIASDIDASISDLSDRISSMEAKRILCSTLLSDAESNLTAAIQEYENKMVSIQKERAYRYQELSIKETEVASARKIESWRRKQESHIRTEEGHIQTAGGHSDDSVESFSARARGKGESQRQKKRNKILQLESELTNLSKKVAENGMSCSSDCSSNEAFFSCLKQLAGVDGSTDDIIRKLISRQDQKRRLLLEKKEAEGRYITVKNRLADSQSQLSILLSTTCTCSPDAHEQNRSKLEEIIKSMNDERLESKKVNSAYMHLADVFIRVQQGAIGLVQKIILHRGNLLDEELPMLNSNFFAVGMYSRDIHGNTLKILEILNYFICKMLEDIGGTESINQQNLMLARSSSSLLKGQTGVETDALHLGVDNCRIQSVKVIF